MHLDEREVDVSCSCTFCECPITCTICCSLEFHGTCSSCLTPMVSRAQDNGCIVEVLNASVFHGFLAPLTCCEPPPGLVGSFSLIETQMQLIPESDGTEASHVRSLTEVNGHQITRILAPPPDAKRPSKFLPEICDPMPDAKKRYPV